MAKYVNFKGSGIGGRGAIAFPLLKFVNWED